LKKLIKKSISIFLALTIVFSLFSFYETNEAFAATTKLNETRLYLAKGETYKLKVYNTSKKVTWLSSKKSVATVSSKGLVKAKSNGKATITAKVGSKKYTCKVTVKKPYSRKYVENYYYRKGSYKSVKVAGKSEDKKYNGETCYFVGLDYKVSKGCIPKANQVYVGSQTLKMYKFLDVNKF